MSHNVYYLPKILNLPELSDEEINALWDEFAKNGGKLSEPIQYPEDPLIEEVLNRIKSRADGGLVKFGVSMDAAEGSSVKWIDDTIEELLDAIVYLTKLKKTLNANRSDGQD